MAFHWRDGWFFRRVHGDVHVRRYTIEQQQESQGGRDDLGFPASPTAPDVAFIVPAAEWASIIASVSSIGETSEQYEAAKRFHGE